MLKPSELLKNTLGLLNTPGNIITAVILFCGAVATVMVLALAAPSFAAEDIVVGVTPFPHKDIMLVAKPLLAKEGYNLVIKEFTDYVQPNMRFFSFFIGDDQAKAAPWPEGDADSIMQIFYVIIPINLKIALTGQAMNKLKSDNSIIYG